MKIIDLLYKIANGKKVPKIIKFWEREYILDEEYNCYLHQTGGNEFIDLLDNNDDDLQCFLNDEVEIIEEETKSLTKQDIEALGYACGKIKKTFENGWNKAINNEPLKEDKDIPLIPDDELYKIDNDEKLYEEKYAIDYNFKVLKEKVNQVVEEMNRRNNASSK